MPEVNLTKRIALPEGRRFLPIAVAANGRIKQEHVIIDGHEVRKSGGQFYIEWRENGQRRREAVGTNPAQAVARQQRKKAELIAAAVGVDFTPEGGKEKTNLKESATEYLREIKLTKKPKTLSAYRTALEYFQESCKKFWVEDVDRTDLLEFSAFLRDDKEQSPRSCRNKFENVMTFLRALGSPSKEGRLAGLRRRGTRGLREERPGRTICSMRFGRASVVGILPDDRHARAGSDVLLLVRCELHTRNGSRVVETEVQLDAKGLQGT